MSGSGRPRPARIVLPGSGLFDDPLLRIHNRDNGVSARKCRYSAQRDILERASAKITDRDRSQENTAAVGIALIDTHSDALCRDGAGVPYAQADYGGLAILRVGNAE